MLLQKVYVKVLMWVYLGSYLFLNSNAKNCSCYSLFTSKTKSWDESQKQCSINGGGLVSIETNGEWVFINKKVQQRHLGDKELWIGLRKRNRIWKWTNGRLLTISKWQPIEDQNPKGYSHCAAMSTEHPSEYQGLFKDENCAIQKQFICEYDINQAMCKRVSKDYIYCTGIPFYEASSPVFTGNSSETYRESAPSLSINTTNTAPPRTASSTSSTQSAASSDKIGILIFIILCGITLFILSGCFIYVFCWCFYQPGYQGDGRKTKGNLHEASQSSSHLSGETYKSQKTRFYVNFQQNNDAYRTDESWDTSGSEDLDHTEHHRYVATQQDDNGREGNDEKVPIIYTQIHKTQFHESSKNAENQYIAGGGGAEGGTTPLVYAQIHKSLSTKPLMAADDENGKNNFEMKPIDSDYDHQTQDEEQPKTPKKPPRSHVVVYANLQDLKHKPHNHDDERRLRSKTAYAKVTFEEKEVSIEADENSQRRKSWSSRSHWCDVGVMKSNETSDVTKNIKDPEGSAVEVAPSSKAIYSKVDISKKTKDRKRLDK